MSTIKEITSLKGWEQHISSLPHHAPDHSQRAQVRLLEAVKKELANNAEFFKAYSIKGNDNAAAS
ncbi:hypothetical protein QBC38DRAFT_453128 [Podospora fimiseda]|uniref:Uncharacterized protein n=1 Tax=Podospora fimiseda TaxID=252190 RepID=A0AAN7BTV3_9PEZI|nr:hypothetical protein QBC38DRAFT_453128 [Podospora fimiseda]